MDKKIQVIALFGPSGCGKDTIRKALIEKYNFHSIVSSTTRPKRNNEIEDLDYHFLTEENFAKNILNGEMLEATSFNGWFYGTLISDLNKDKVNVGVFNIHAIECLIEDGQLDIFPVYIKTNDRLRLLRNLNREVECDCDEICRRFIADRKDFVHIDFPHFIVENNEDKTPNNVAEEIYDIL